MHNLTARRMLSKSESNAAKLFYVLTLNQKPRPVGGEIGLVLARLKLPMTDPRGGEVPLSQYIFLPGRRKENQVRSLCKEGLSQPALVTWESLPPPSLGSYKVRSPGRMQLQAGFGAVTPASESASWSRQPRVRPQHGQALQPDWRCVLQ